MVQLSKMDEIRNDSNFTAFLVEHVWRPPPLPSHSAASKYAHPSSRSVHVLMSNCLPLFCFLFLSTPLSSNLLAFLVSTVLDSADALLAEMERMDKINALEESLEKITTQVFFTLALTPTSLSLTFTHFTLNHSHYHYSLITTLVNSHFHSYSHYLTLTLILTVTPDLTHLQLETGKKMIERESDPVKKQKFAGNFSSTLLHF